MRWLIAIAAIMVMVTSHANAYLPGYVTSVPNRAELPSAPLVGGGWAYVQDVAEVFIYSTTPCSIGGGDGDGATEVKAGTGCWVLSLTSAGTPVTVTTLAGVDTQTGPITIDGYAVGGFSQPDAAPKALGGYTAQQIFEWAIGPGSTPAPTYDALRGVAVAPSGSTSLLINAISGYVLDSTSRSGPPYDPVPVSAAINGIGIADADGAGVWGINTILTDNRGQSVSSHGPRFLFNEFDCNATSANTTCALLNMGGTALVQPASLTGPTCLKMSAATPDVLWDYCFGTADGVGNTAIEIGTKTTGASSVTSQNVNLHYKTAGGVRSVVSFASQPDGAVLFAKTGGGMVALANTITAGLLYYTPASSSEACAPGQASFDSTYIYFCVNNNVWHRVSNGSTW